MKILLVEPYNTGSHASWAKGYAQHSQHHIDILSLPGRFWKWRMHGGAVTLARKFLESASTPDLILATDMLDLTTFLALTRQKTANLPSAIYFHENQLTYPWSPTDRDVAQKRNKHYGFINYTSALVADVALFNSVYHQESFLDALPQLLRHFPDYNELKSVEQIREKSQVLALGLDLQRFDEYLDNHRYVRTGSAFATDLSSIGRCPGRFARSGIGGLCDNVVLSVGRFDAKGGHCDGRHVL